MKKKKRRGFSLTERRASQARCNESVLVPSMEQEWLATPGLDTAACCSPPCESTRGTHTRTGRLVHRFVRACTGFYLASSFFLLFTWIFLASPCLPPFCPTPLQPPSSIYSASDTLVSRACVCVCAHGGVSLHLSERGHIGVVTLVGFKRAGDRTIVRY